MLGAGHIISGYGVFMSLTNGSHSVLSGLDVLVNETFMRLKNKRVAILANQASIDRNLEHIVSLALHHGVNVVKLFAPEHGFSGAMQDMEQVSFNTHRIFGVPIISLYGDHKESLRLRAEHLNDVDILLCDLQDIGARYYTFHCTIAWAMAACHKSNTRLMVVDRPNPINGSTVEGNVIKAANFSFVGAYPILNRHGFTMGELVHYVADILSVDLDLEVIWMKDYRRSDHFDDTGLIFVPPSPNMPTLATAQLYPGMCLIEGTNLSEARGTCNPFELVGAPYIEDEFEFVHRINRLDFTGVKLRPYRFRPKFHKHAGKDCGGAFVHILDRERFSPLRFALGLIWVASSYDGFDWRREPYEFEEGRLAIDLLLGDEKIRKMLEERAPLVEIFSMFESEEKSFSVLRQKYLRYP